MIISFSTDIIPFFGIGDASLIEVWVVVDNVGALGRHVLLFVEWVEVSSHVGFLV